MEAAPEFWQHPEFLQQVYVASPRGEQVPLSAFTHYAPATAPLSVNHQGLFPAVTISFNLAPGIALDNAVTAIHAAARTVGLPSTIQTTLAGTAEAYQQSLGSEPLLIATARLTDNRVVWIVLAAVFATASLAAALRWPQTFTRTPMRWIAPLAVLLFVLALAFADVVEERAGVVAPNAGLTASIERDPRLILWEHVIERIGQRPLTGYGFGRRILAGSLAAEMGDPLLAHAHNVFASQWLQTGLVGMLAFMAFIGALALRYLRFLRSRDDTLAFVGVAGLALLAGFVAKDLTDDFLFRSNAKELWAMTAMLLGYGMRRERMLAAGDVPTLAGRSHVAETRAVERRTAPVSDAAEPATAASPSPPHRQSESA
jgi:hypothetical protein